MPSTHGDSSIQGVEELINNRRSVWRDLVSSQGVQGSSPFANAPKLLQRDREWVSRVEEVLKGKTADDKEDIQTVLNFIVNDGVVGGNEILSDDIEVVNAALAILKLRKFAKMDDYTQEIKDELSWVSDAPTDRLGSNYKIDVELETEEVENGSAAEEKGVDKTPADGDKDTKPSVRVTVTKGGEQIFPAVAPQEGGCAEPAMTSEKKTEYENARDLVGKIQEEFRELIGLGVEPEKAVKMLADPCDVVNEYKNLLEQISKLESRVRRFEAKNSKDGHQEVRIRVNKDCCPSEPENQAATSDAEGGSLENKGNNSKGLQTECSQERTSELFQGLKFSKIHELYVNALASQVEDIDKLKDSLGKVNSNFDAKNESETSLNDLEEALKKSEAELTGKPTAQQDDEGDKAANELNSVREKLGMISSARQLKADLSEFAKRVEKVNAHSAFLKKRDGMKGFAKFKSNFNSKLAISRPLTALFLSGLAAAAASVITAAATAAVLYSVATSLAMYSAQRLWAIRQISARHNVKMANLSSDAVHYTSRVEAVAAIAPIFISVVAPVALPAKYAAQATIYCGSVAMRAVYSAVASVFMNRVEVASDAKNSQPAVDADHFSYQAQTIINNEIPTSSDQAKFINESIQHIKVDPSMFKQVPFEGSEQASSVEIDSAKGFLEKMKENTLQPNDIDGLPGLVKSIDQKPESFKSYPKAASLLRLLKSIEAQSATLKKESIEVGLRKVHDEHMRGYLFDSVFPTSVKV